MIAAILIIMIPIVLTSIAYVYAVDKMMDEHPDYKGDDFLN